MNVDLGILITICEKAISAGNKLVKKYRNKKLSDEEKELLIAASRRGEFHILSVDQIPGSWVRVGNKDFLNPEDPAFSAKYRDALRFLCERGYVKHEEGRLFALTGSGFSKARLLVQKGQ